jgi:hypothetical protein
MKANMGGLRPWRIATESAENTDGEPAFSTVLKTSVTKVLNVLESSEYTIKPKKTHYDCLETDEFWTYVGKKKNKVWLIYVYNRGSGEIVAYG